MITEKAHRLNDPSDYGTEIIIITNPSRTQLRTLVKTKPAVRGLALFDREETFAIVNAHKCDHHTLKELLVYELGYNERYVEESIEIFCVRQGSPEEASWDSLFVEVNDMLVGTRTLEYGGMSFKNLKKAHRGFRRAIEGYTEDEIENAIRDLLRSEGSIEENLSKKIASTLGAASIMASTFAMPVASIMPQYTASVEASELEPEPKVSEPKPEPEEIKKYTNELENDFDERDLRYLALTMWGEARSHGEEGMRAVGHVIMNRLALSQKSNRASRRYGSGSVENVVKHRRQFSCWNENDPNRSRMENIDNITTNSPDHQAWETAQQLASEILFNRSTDPTQGAVMYHADYVSPRWASADSMILVTQVENHLFYKDSDVQPV